MVRLTNEYGTFEAETEQECLKLARKAKREDKERQRRDHERWERAHSDAEIRALRMYNRIVPILLGKRGAMIPAWEVVAPTTGGIGLTVEPGPYGDIASYEGVSYDHHGYRVVGAIIDAGGWIFGVITRPDHVLDDSRDEVLAVGIHEGTVAFRTVEIPAAAFRKCVQTILRDATAA